MKQILFVLFLSCSVSWSQVYMNINNKDGTTKTFTIDEIRKLTFSGVIGVKEAKTLSDALKSFTLLQNYPNPFNPSTTIQYEIPKAGDVKVIIYNITGELIKTITDEFQNAGNYKVDWNSKNELGKNVASGIYLFQVKYDNAFLTKKLMLIK